ncbi:MAG: hypothetical protein WC538_20050 [Thermoanaerobaculia bacterium]|jgi:hypothetical protein
MRFNRVAASVFAAVALAHVVRGVTETPIQLGSVAIPVWLSWVGALGAGMLCVWGFRSGD